MPSLACYTHGPLLLCAWAASKFSFAFLSHCFSEILSDSEREQVFSLAYLWGGEDFLPCDVNGLL